MPRFALTFDDGPGPTTAEILDILAEAGVHATFFVLGRNVEEAPWCDGDTGRARALVARMFREGHTVGNHTYSHARPEKWRELAADLRRGDEVLRALRREVGLPADGPIPVRLPYGIQLVHGMQTTPLSTSPAAVLDPRLAVLASLGRTHVHWTSDFEDWTLPASEGHALAARMVAHIEQAAALGLDAVLDLHDSGTGSGWGYARPATAIGVRILLAEAAARGFLTFTVPA